MSRGLAMRTPAVQPAYDALAVVDAVMRLLERERVPVSVSSIERCVEDAGRLLRHLGIEAAPR